MEYLLGIFVASNVTTSRIAVFLIYVMIASGCLRQVDRGVKRSITFLAFAGVATCVMPVAWLMSHDMLTMYTISIVAAGFAIAGLVLMVTVERKKQKSLPTT